jgi:hypothetical protein
MIPIHTFLLLLILLLFTYENADAQAFKENRVDAEFDLSALQNKPLMCGDSIESAGRVNFETIQEL